MSRRSGRVITQPNRYLGLAETQVILPYDGIEDPVGFYVLKLKVCKQKHILFSIRLLLMFIQ